MSDIKYAVVMRKQKINNQIFILLPTKLVEGTLDNSEGYYFYTEDGKRLIDLYNPISMTNSEIEEVAAYTISESYLLQKYPDYSKEEAKNDYFNKIHNAINIAVYFTNRNETGIIPFYLDKAIDKINNKSKEEEPELSVALDIFSDISFMPVDQYGYPLSPYELEQIGYNDSVESSFNKVLEQLLKIEDNYTIHKILEKMYEGNEDLNEIISSLSFSNMIEEATKDNFQKISISDIFLNSCSHILAINDKDEIIDIVNQTIDFLTTIYCQFHDYCIIEEQPEVESACDFLDNLTTWYKELMDNNIDINNIHKQIENLKEQQINNMQSVHKNYQAVLEQYKNNNLHKESNNKPEKETSVIDIVSAKKYLDERVIGQENAKKKMICAIWNKQVGNEIEEKMPAYCLLIGPTGSGKTLLAETIANYLEVPSIIFDTTQLTATGYVGDSITDSLTRLLSKANNNVKKAEQGIIIFDEIDKKGSDSNKDIAGKGALNALLPYLDGRTYYLDVNKKQIPFKTDKLMIIATGSFAEAIEMKQHKSYSSSSAGFLRESATNTTSIELTSEDLIEYGGIPKELVARIPVIIMLESHTKNSLKEILYHKQISPLYKNAKAFHYVDKHFCWSNGYIDAAADKALELGYGARSLNNIVENSIIKAKWEVLSNTTKYAGFKVTEDTVYDSENATLYGYAGEEYQLKEILAEKKEAAMQYKKK